MGETRVTSLVIAAAILVAALIAGWALVSSGAEEGSSVPVTEVSDTATIQERVDLANLSIATSENFARQKIYVISAYLKNISDKPLRTADVKMVFTDFDGKPIHEYTERVLEQNQKPVPPGGAIRFEVRQENLPRAWNYRVPITEIVKLGY